MFLTVALTGCGAGDSLVLPGDGEPSTIRVMNGNRQSGRVGEELADPLTVRVTDSRGHPVAGAEVAFELTDAGPGAEVMPATATTDVKGQADTRITLGTRMGPQAGEARLVLPEGSPPSSPEPKVSFTSTALSENANGIAAVSGQDQSGPAGSVLSDPLVVEVTDAFGNPISGITVNWAVEGGGSVSQTSLTTDDQGQASVQRQLGPTAGEQKTIASSEGLAGSPVTFTHTATAGNAAGLTIVTGNNQSAEVGTRVPVDPVVLLTDADGNPVAGAPVTWVVSIGGGRVTPENGTTDGNGRASAGWTLGPAPGENRLDAVVSGVGVASFTATGRSSAPGATITTITSDSPDPSVAGTTFTVEFQVTSGSGVPPGSVTVTVSGGTPSCSANLSSGRGSCQLTLGIVGDRILTATYSGATGFARSSDTEPHRVNPVVPGNRAPHSDFNWHCDGLTCQFTDASSDRDGRVVSWLWDFGDGSTSTLKDPAHTYAAAARYEVKLTVTDDDGASDDATARVDVEGPPPPPTPGSTTTAITSDNPDPSDQGAAITVGFTVTSSSGTPTGTVLVTDPNGGSCTGSAPSGSCSYTPGGAGTRTITATYQGNSSFNGSSATESHTVNAPPPPPASTTTAITGDSPDPSNPGVAITVSFTVSSSSGTPTGAVQVTDQNGGGCNGSAPSGSCSYTPNGTGTRTITATYQGNSSFAGSSATDQHTVTTPPAATTTAITSDQPDPSVQNVPFTVNFTVSSSSGAPSGQVTVSDGTDNCTGTLDGSGAGSCQLTLTTVGPRTLTATYPGNSSFNGSTGTEAHTVNPPPPAETTTGIVSDDPDASVSDQPVLVVFTVTSAAGTPSGDVVVTVSDGPESCTATVVVGQCSIVLVSTGSRTLTATYAGNDSFAGSSDNESHNVEASSGP